MSLRSVMILYALHNNPRPESGTMIQRTGSEYNTWNPRQLPLLRDWETSEHHCRALVYVKRSVPNVAKDCGIYRERDLKHA